MKNIILVAGGTGNLGGKLIKALLERNAGVRIIVRSGNESEKINDLEQMGVKVFRIKFPDSENLARVCNDVSCVVSALQGLPDVVVHTQTLLLDAAIKAGVPRFIPSDYSLNFTMLPEGENRNFDLRREFDKVLDKASISSTSIFNGAFAEILTNNIPILDCKKNIVRYWGENPDWKLDFTTMDDTATFTAEAVLDPTTPRYLNIAGFQVSPVELSAIAGEITKSEFKLVHMGSLEEFSASIKREREANTEGENELFSKWQHAQFIHDMFSINCKTPDNDRYPGLNWTGAKQFIKKYLEC